MSSADPLSKPRIASLDQFRGYTVAGMCLANFLAPFLSTPAQLKHNESWFSYADSIMPSFFFVVGYSFRLTYLRRRATTTRLKTVQTYLWRSMVLFGLSFAIYALTVDWSRWTQFEKMPPEFQADRRMPPAMQSFELLVPRARQAVAESRPSDPRSTDKDLRAVLDSAERIGSLINASESRDADRRLDYQAAENAARAAQAEVDEFLAPAIERVRAWRALSGTQRMLVYWRIAVGRMFKAELWETLAMIAAAQLLVLPWIGFRPLVRFGVLIAYAAVHGALCAWFNWDFVYGVNHNWMSRLWITGNCRSWDGGVFGPPAWAVAILAGTLAYDLVQGTASTAASARRLFLFAAAFIVCGYVLSCLSRFYDLNASQISALRERRWRETAARVWLGTLIDHEKQRIASRRQSGNPEAPKERGVAAISRHEQDLIKMQACIAVLQDEREAYPDLDLAPKPFVPDWSQVRQRPLTSLLAEPPFVSPPRDGPQALPALEHRLWNYWMLSKRVPTLSFMLLASGAACLLYSLFVIACDGFGWQVGLFRTFGTNALVAYFTHGMLALAVWAFIPSTAGLPAAVGAFCVFFALTWFLVRQLEKRGIYIKL
jgi:Heparan-alpha-glucosaminide N-acetyltransferase, catalytic